MNTEIYKVNTFTGELKISTLNEIIYKGEKLRVYLSFSSIDKQELINEVFLYDQDNSNN
jgi:hypothetical protein